MTPKSKKHKKQKPTEEERASSSVQGGNSFPLANPFLCHRNGPLSFLNTLVIPSAVIPECFYQESTTSTGGNPPITSKKNEKLKG